MHCLSPVLTKGVSSMSTAGTCCQWIRARHRRISAGVVIAHEIITESNFVARSEASAESRVSIIDSSVDDADLDSFASDAFIVEFLDVGRE